jgi:hypothetical protein
LLGLFLVDDEAAVSGIINNNTWTKYVTISNSQKSFSHIVLKLEAGIKDSEHFSIALLIVY